MGQRVLPDLSARASSQVDKNSARKDALDVAAWRVVSRNTLRVNEWAKKM